MNKKESVRPKGMLIAKENIVIIKYSIVFIFPKGFKLFPAKILPFSFPCNYFPKLSIIPTNLSPTNLA